jgi:hypothetical protein
MPLAHDTKILLPPMFESVALFRLRALRLLILWTQHWLNHVEGRTLSFADAETIVLEIQITCWKKMKRTPTVAEWVENIHHRTMRFNGTPETTLVLLKPWVFRWYEAGKNMDVALANFSQDVENEFCRWWLPAAGHVPTWLSACRNEEDILTYLRAWVEPYRSLWTRTREFWTAVILGRHIYSL